MSATRLRHCVCVGGPVPFQREIAARCPVHGQPILTPDQVIANLTSGACAVCGEAVVTKPIKGSTVGRLVHADRSRDRLHRPTLGGVGFTRHSSDRWVIGNDAADYAADEAETATPDQTPTRA